jgi:hypothetical protein
MVVLAIKMRREAPVKSIFAPFIPFCGPLSTDVLKTAMIAPAGFWPRWMARGLHFLGRIVKVKYKVSPGATRRDFSPANVS